MTREEFPLKPYWAIRCKRKPEKNRSRMPEILECIFLLLIPFAIWGWTWIVLS